jgi:hypothetical protein
VRQLKILAVVMMVVAAVVTWLLMYRASGWLKPFDRMVAWALAPYVVLSCYALLPRSDFPVGVAARATFWACLAVFVYTLAAYLDGSFVHTSSTTAIGFLFVPVWALLGGLVVGECLIETFAKRAARAR